MNSKLVCRVVSPLPITHHCKHECELYTLCLCLVLSLMEEIINKSEDSAMKNNVRKTAAKLTWGAGILITGGQEY